MAFVKMVIQLVLAIEHLATVSTSARKEGAVMLLHMTAVLSRTTESISASVRTLAISCNSNMLNLIVDLRHHGCDRDMGMDAGLGSDGYVHGMWGNSVDVALIHFMEAIDIGK